jgi:hypothetical protein
MDDEKLLEYTSENEENSFQPVNEDAFQDIDSDESCPLQQYRSDDPLKYISINLNDSTACTSASVSPMNTPKKDSINIRSVKTPLSHENVLSKLYEEQTDQSSDNEVQSSPILNKNINRKKFKLSNRSHTINNTSELAQSISTNDEFTDIENRRIIARNLCEAIVNDFSVDELNDNMSSKYIEKCT